VALSVYQHWLCICLAAAVKVAAAKPTQWLKHAATHGVATAFSSRVAAKLAATATLFAAACKQVVHGVAVMQTSATKIDGAKSIYYFTASLLHVCLFVREKMMCWWLALARKKMWWWIASFGYSFLFTMPTHYNVQNKYFLSSFWK
jgi:hypothetical protein